MKKNACFMDGWSINYNVKTRFSDDEKAYSLDEALELLNAIQQSGNLRLAAEQCGYSYRKAWNKLKELEVLVNFPLVEKKQGKGSNLSALGCQFLRMTQENNTLFNEAIRLAEIQANTFLGSLWTIAQPIRVIASDSVKLDVLRSRHRLIRLTIEGSGQALMAYAQGKCELAGFHLNNRQQFIDYRHYFDPLNDRFMLLEQRRQGLLSHPQRPVESLQQVVEQQLNFVNRQQGSGTRSLLDSMLATQHIQPENLPGYFHEEHTHLAVASMVFSGQVDAGLAIQQVAERLKLHFKPLANEYYFLVFKTLSTELEAILTELIVQNNLNTVNFNEFCAQMEDVLS